METEDLRVRERLAGGYDSSLERAMEVVFSVVGVWNKDCDCGAAKEAPCAEWIASNCAREGVIGGGCC